MTTPSTATPPDYEAIKTKQRAVWGTGDYARIGSLLQISGERLIEAMDARPGTRFLDVAAGNGNLTMAAARRFCEVTSTDYVEALLARSGDRAHANGFEIAYRVADAEALPFEAASFDAVGSTFGVMFTPNQEQAASELARVCKPGGKIGLANWTPAGFIGQLFKTIGSFVPPPAGVSSPARWGTERFLEEQFGGIGDVVVRRRDYVFRFLSAEHFLDYFLDWYGPTIKAFEALDEDGKSGLRQAILDLCNESSRAPGDTLRVDSEYLEVVITKR